MGKKIKRFPLVLCVLVLCISAVGIPVMAASAAVSIPVRITLKGDAPAVPETFLVEFSAADPAYPMPAGAENGSYTLAIQGSTSETIDIVFPARGVYDYTVKLKAGANGACDYDDAVYAVTVFVTNRDTAAGYDLSLIVHRHGETGKQDDIHFENVYETKTNSPQTGDGAQLWLWITLQVLSAAGIGALVILRRRANPFME